MPVCDALGGGQGARGVRGVGRFGEANSFLLEVRARIVVGARSRGEA